MNAKIVKAERNTKQISNLFLLPRRILSSRSKDSESRAQCKTKDEVFVFIAEAHPIFAKQR